MILKDSSRVAEVNTTNTTVTLEDGSVIEADLIVGADGVSVRDSPPFIMVSENSGLTFCATPSPSRENLSVLRHLSHSTQARVHSGS